MLALGGRLARALDAPAFVALHGELGAGKTALVRGMGAALGESDVTSPTFTIAHEYATQPKLYHFDAYRLADAEELMAIGFTDYLNEDALIVMEWAELVEDALPRERIDISIVGSGEGLRTVRIQPNGARYEGMAERI